MNVKREVFSLDQPLSECAATYFERCDAYDRMVCTGVSPYTGEPLPATDEELWLVNRHAFRVIAEIVESRSLTREALLEAIRDYSHAERGA